MYVVHCMKSGVMTMMRGIVIEMMIEMMTDEEGDNDDSDDDNDDDNDDNGDDNQMALGTSSACV